MIAQRGTVRYKWVWHVQRKGVHEEIIKYSSGVISLVPGGWPTTCLWLVLFSSSLLDFLCVLLASSCSLHPHQKARITSCRAVAPTGRFSPDSIILTALGGTVSAHTFQVTGEAARVCNLITHLVKGSASGFPRATELFTRSFLFCISVLVLTLERKKRNLRYDEWCVQNHPLVTPASSRAPAKRSVLRDRRSHNLLAPWVTGPTSLFQDRPGL